MRSWRRAWNEEGWKESLHAEIRRSEFGNMWLVKVQLDLDPELGLQREMCMAMKTKLEIQRTIKRAKLTAFLWFLKKMIIDPKIDDGGCGIKI